MGFTTSDNKFSITPYIVGATLGDGVNYISIQTAINDAFAAGGGTVYIRPGTYSPSLTLRAAVDLVGVSADGRTVFNLPADEVVISGAHTFSGSGTVAMRNIVFTDAADQFTITSAAGTGHLLFDNCTVRSTINRAVVMTPGGGGAAKLSATSTYFISSIQTIQNSGASEVILEDCDLVSTGGSVNILYGSTATNSTIKNCNFTGDTGVQITNAAGAVILRENFFTETGNGVSFTAAGSVFSYYNIWNSADASTNYIAGAAGTYDYTGDVLIGTATNIAGTITQTFNDWKPYASTTHVGVSRYNPADFSVNSTTGEVSALNSATFTWNTTAVSIANMSVANGYFAIAAGGALTFGLPTTSILGDEVRLSLRGATSWQITQAAGQQIVVGSTSTTAGAGGSITSTAQGDSIHLVCSTANLTWVMQSSVGNPMVV